MRRQVWRPPLLGWISTRFWIVLLKEIIKQQIIWIHMVFDHHVQKPYKFNWSLNIRKPYEFRCFLIMIRTPINLYDGRSPEHNMILYYMVLCCLIVSLYRTFPYQMCSSGDQLLHPWLVGTVSDGRSRDHAQKSSLADAGKNKELIGFLRMSVKIATKPCLLKIMLAYLFSVFPATNAVRWFSIDLA